MKNGWQKRTIGEVCHLMTGGTPSKANREYFGGDIKWLVSGDIHRREIIDCEGRITQLGMKNSNTKYLPIDSVMIALNGQGKTRGTVALLRTKATCNQSLVAMYPKKPDEILPEYLYANLHGRYEEIRRMTGDSGNDRRGLNMHLISEIEIPIAPPAEQRRIVAMLDKAFAAIATAKANTEKNLRNSRAVFVSRLQRVFAERGEKWVDEKLGDICEFEGGSQPPKSQFVYEKKPGFIRFLQIRDFASDKNITYIRESSKNRHCRENDILIGRYGASVGRILTGKAGSYNVALVKTIPNQQVVDRGWFYNYLISEEFQGRLLNVADRSAQNGFSKEDIYGFPVPIPPIAEQRRIVGLLAALSSQTQRLKSIYQQKVEALEELKRSLLNEAFTGAL